MAASVIMRGSGALSRPERSRMRAWEIRQKRAQKRARELARKEKNKHAKETSTFRLVVAGRGGEPSVVASVIVKNPDESVAEATFEEIEPGITLIVEGESGLIQRVVVEEKLELDEPEPMREVRVRLL
jgi:hypothetical protein